MHRLLGVGIRSIRSEHCRLRDFQHRHLVGDGTLKPISDRNLNVLDLDRILSWSAGQFLCGAFPTGRPSYRHEIADLSLVQRSVLVYIALVAEIEEQSLVHRNRSRKRHESKQSHCRSDRPYNIDTHLRFPFKLFYGTFVDFREDLLRTRIEVEHAESVESCLSDNHDLPRHGYGIPAQILPA